MLLNPVNDRFKIITELTIAHQNLYINENLHALCDNIAWRINQATATHLTLVC